MIAINNIFYYLYASCLKYIDQYNYHTKTVIDLENGTYYERYDDTFLDKISNDY
jgi:hypothetical protein